MHKLRAIFLFISVILCAGSIYAQVQPRGTGLIFDDESYSKVPSKAHLTRSLYNNIPRKASLKDYCPEIGNQGQYSTCVAWSSAWAGRTILWARANNVTDKKIISQNVFSPAFIYANIEKADTSCSLGSRMNEALDLIKIKGVVKYSDFSGYCLHNISGSLYQKAMANRIKDYSKLFTVDAADKIKIESVKKSLSEGFPVLIGMSCPLSFQVATTELWVPQESSVGKYMGHAMCVIGYDDDKYGGAFEIMNSWGTDWGANGFIWVKYGDMAAFSHYGFEMVQDMAPIVAVTTKHATAPKAPGEIYLAGKMRLVDDNGKVMPASLNFDRSQLANAGQINDYHLNSVYQSGKRFRIYLENDAPAYVYLFASDSSGQINNIFPADDKTSPLMNYRLNEIAIPDEDYFIQMDDKKGVDYLCLLYSKEPLDLESIKAKIQAEQGSFKNRVFKALADKIAKPANVQLQQNEIVFSSKSNDRSLLPVIVEIRHN